jgi:hypothetical protein
MKQNRESRIKSTNQVSQLIVSTEVKNLHWRKGRLQMEKWVSIHMHKNYLTAIAKINPNGSKL